MNHFSELLDRLAYEASRNNKLRLLVDYFRTQADPDRGYALAAMTGALKFTHAKPALVRSLIAECTDPVLFAMSYDYVGDLSETVALMWPRPDPAPAVEGSNAPHAPTLSDIVETLQVTRKADVPAQLTQWLDKLDETGRWALLKLITGGLRIGVSARLAKTAIAALGDKSPNDVEEVWHGLRPPYLDLFAWIEGRAARPISTDSAPFRTPMLSHAIDETDFASMNPDAYCAEWKWDGIRVQAVGGRDANGARVRRLYSRTGEDISASFPDMVEALAGEGFDDAAIDGELLVVREGRVQSFNTLQQRLNRKTVSAKLIADYPLMIRAYDLIAANGEDLRGLDFSERRRRLEHFIALNGHDKLDLSPIVAFESWQDLTAARADPGLAGADAAAIEGVMLKQRNSIYLPGRPRGPWWKWKRDPMNVDAVLMYAQRGHGKRSSFYSDYTFGLWRAAEGGGEELVPVGKAYFGFTDAELVQIDRWVRTHTLNRFGPVREVTATQEEGLVFEVAFEGVNVSTRRKSGVALRFPRIARIRWDKPSREADRIDALQKLLRDSS